VVMALLSFLSLVCKRIRCCMDDGDDDDDDNDDDDDLMVVILFPPIGLSPTLPPPSDR